MSPERERSDGGHSAASDVSPGGCWAAKRRNWLNRFRAISPPSPRVGLDLSATEFSEMMAGRTVPMDRQLGACRPLGTS